jgi:tol-pal system protein YbgF
MKVDSFSLMTKKLPVWLLLATLSGLFGCAQPQQIDLIEREQRRLRNDTSSVQSDVESLRSALADTRANVQQLQRELGAIKAQIEETRYQMGRQIGQSSLQGDQRIKALEDRVAKLDELSKTQGAQLKLREEELNKLREGIQGLPTPPAQGAAPSGAQAELWAGETDAVKRDYEIAWSALEKKDYRLAIQRFKDFLKRYPRSNLADNAQYWIGESYYALREFDQAILEFDAVRRNYPQGEKVPAALLKQGYSFAELGEKVNARLILQEVIEKFPQSPEAIRAKEKLKTLES